MDTSDPTVSAQPEGQDAGGTTDAPYAEYLNRIPEQVRGDVEPIFKEWDSNVTKRFQDAATYRDTWQPYEQAGVANLPPDTVSELVQFYDTLNTNPAAIVEWARGIAEQNQIPFGDTSTQQEPAPADEYEFGGLDPNVLDTRLKPLLDKLEQFEQRFAQQDQHAQLEQANRQIETAIKQLEEKHPGDVDRDLLDTFLARHVNAGSAERAVNLAWADLQSVRAKFEKGFVAPRVGLQPGGEPGGPASAAPEPIKTLEDANRIARERIAASRQP